MKKILSAAFGLFFASALSAQAASIIRMNINGKDPAAHSPVRLTNISVNAKIMGNIAVTTLDMFFQNDSNRILEGEFEFPLGENETITGYALDINGKMRQAVVVEKDKGRQVFEAVVRQGIDPGLIEMTSGNNFKTRIYPIPAKGSRHVQITYQSELKKSYSNDSRTYVYSALTSDKLEHFDFNITTLGNNNHVRSESNTLQFDELDCGYTAHFSRDNTSITTPISIVIPNAYTNIKNSDNGTGSAFLQDKGKDTFFYYYLPLDGTTVAKKLPKKLAVYYDVSASGTKRNCLAEIAFLRGYIEKLDNPAITLIPFCNELFEAKQFSGSTEAIMTGILNYIQECSFDGATNLGYDFAALYPADEVLIFTDGIGNWDDSLAKGKIAVRRPEGQQPVVNTINSSAFADHAWMNNTARLNGGVYINLYSTVNAANDSLNEKWNFENELKSITQEPYRLIRTEYDASAIEDVFPIDGSIAGPDFSISGKLRRKQGIVTLYFGHGNSIEQTVKLEVSTSNGIYADNVARQWASSKIDALNHDYEANRNEILELSKQYGIVTKDTSLIVLDSVQDYVRYNIVPPEELKAEYNRIVSQQSKPAKPVETAIPQTVFTKFEEFRKWWNTDKNEFKKKKPGKNGEPIPVPRPPIIQQNELSQADDFADTMEIESVQEERAPRASGRMQLNRQMESTVTRSAKSSASAPAAKAQAIQLQAWNPDSEYLSMLKRAPTASMYKTYLELKKKYEMSPAFYMETSDYFAEEGLTNESIRILSNLAELELENSDILRALGNKLIEHSLYELAVPVFEKLVKIRSEIPQFYRDLGMAYYHAGFTQKAVDTLYSVAYKKWDGRFAEVQQIALNDMNAIIAAEDSKVDLSAIDKNLLQNFDMDVRIVLTWNTDNCDVDLWVTDADGEKCFYGNKLTANGGRMSRDFTQGYGPEEFCIRKAPDGRLKIETNYYGNHQQKLLQPVTVQAEVYTNFGRQNQKRQVLTLQLDSIKETFFIGEVE